MSKAQSQSRLLLTGASGFIGGRLARQMLQSGQDVHLLARPNSNFKSLTDIKDRLTIHIHDGSMDGMTEMMAKANPNTVVHLASLFLATHESRDIAPLIRSNIEFGTQLVEAMVKQNVKHLVNTGTSWQHYDNEAYNPACLYAATKQAFNDILSYYVEASGLRVINLELFDTYGPNDPRRKLFTLIRDAAKQGEALDMSAGEQLIDLVHVDDVVDAFLIALDRANSNEEKGMETFSVSSGNPIPLRLVVETYLNATGRKVQINWGARPYREREVMVPYNKGASLPGWRPKIPLEKGMQTL